MHAQPCFFSLIADGECSLTHSDLRHCDGQRLTITHLFHSALHDIPNGRDLLRLPDPIHTIKGLIFKHRIPLWFHEKDVVCSSQIKPDEVRNYGLIEKSGIVYPVEPQRRDINITRI